MRPFIVIISALIVSFSAFAADNQELGLLVGGISTTGRTAEPSGVPIAIGSGAALQATYAQDLHVLHLKYAEVLGEVHLLLSPQQSLTSGAASATRNYGALYLTPGVRVKFYPKNKLSPWVAAGGGYALYFQSSQALGGSAIPGGHTSSGGALEIGGGADFIASPRLTLRGEIRDFYTESPTFNTAVAGFGQFNFVASAGIVLKLGRK